VVHTCLSFQVKNVERFRVFKTKLHFKGKQERKYLPLTLYKWWYRFSSDRYMDRFCNYMEFWTEDSQLKIDNHLFQT